MEKMRAGSVAELVRLAEKADISPALEPRSGSDAAFNTE
jgi:hypothetical protein